jgi:phosphoribosylanthranilate isomerase
MRVKICGITNLEDAKIAITYGADALGFLVGIRHRAEDAITPEDARRIIINLAPFTSTVLVTHLLKADEIKSLFQQVCATTIQLQDEIPLEEIKVLRKELPNVRLIKAVHVTGPEAVQKALSYEGSVDAITLDSIKREEDRIGGTGLIHDWRISRQVRDSCKLPIILAGGLTPSNVEEAIRTVRPYAVDVNSGVEDPKDRLSGKKNPELVRLFIKKAKMVGESLNL